MTQQATVRPGSLVAGGVAASAGPALAVAGVVAPVVGAALALPLFVVAFGAATLLARRSRGAPAAAVTAPVDPERELNAQLDQVLHDIAGKVPTAVESRVNRIVVVLRDTIPRLDQLGMGSTQAHAAVQTVASYLPEALGAYLRLPRSYADERPVSNGKTSLMVLCDQLDLLAHKMDEVFVAVCQADVDALVAHGRFLAEKFGSGSLKLGSAPGLSLGPGQT